MRRQARESADEREKDARQVLRMDLCMGTPETMTAGANAAAGTSPGGQMRRTPKGCGGGGAAAGAWRQAGRASALRPPRPAPRADRPAESTRRAPAGCCRPRRFRTGNGCRRRSRSRAPRRPPWPGRILRGEPSLRPAPLFMQDAACATPRSARNQRECVRKAAKEAAASHGRKYALRRRGPFDLRKPVRPAGSTGVRASQSRPGRQGLHAELQAILVDVEARAVVGRAVRGSLSGACSP